MDNKLRTDKPYTSILDKFILFFNGINWINIGIYYLILIISLIYFVGVKAELLPGSNSIATFGLPTTIIVLRVSLLIQVIWTWLYYAYCNITKISKKTLQSVSILFYKQNPEPYLYENLKNIAMMGKALRMF